MTGLASSLSAASDASRRASSALRRVDVQLEVFALPDVLHRPIAQRVQRFGDGCPCGSNTDGLRVTNTRARIRRLPPETLARRHDRRGEAARSDRTRVRSRPAVSTRPTSASASSSSLKSRCSWNARIALRCTHSYACSRDTPRRASSSSTVPGKHHAARPIQVLAHALGIDHHAGDDAREAAQHVIERDEAVGQDHALDRRMRDVALVPERVVLERRDRIAAQQPRQPDDLLAADRVALVRHRRRALLALGERLLDLADLGLLKAANLERELLERRAR